MDALAISIFQPAARDEAPAARLNWLDMAAERASGAGSSLLICPELFLSGYGNADRQRDRAQPILGEYSDRVGEIALLHNIAIVFGYSERERAQVFNAAAFMTPKGKLLGHHRKNYLTPGFEADVFGRGEHLRVFEHAGWRIALLIGSDIEYPEAARHSARGGADLLVVPAALAADRQFVAEWLAPVRAWENGVFLAFANWAGGAQQPPFAGCSRVIGPDGEEDALAGTGEQILEATLEPARLQAARAHLPYLAELVDKS